MIAHKASLLRRLALAFAVFLWLAPSMADAAPRYLVYVQHFPPAGADSAPDTACPMAPDGRFVAGTYRAQIVFFPSDAQRAQPVEGKTLGERLPRPWGALGLAWAAEGSGIGWLSSLSSQSNEDKTLVEVRPPLASPLWMAPSQRGAPPLLPPFLEAIFRPLLPQGSSADLLKLFCAAEPRSAAADIQLVRIHRILAQPTSSADDIAAVREFLLPGQAVPDINSWKALLDKASSASPAAFLFADYLGDKVFTRQQYLYGRFVEEVRKKVEKSANDATSGQNYSVSVGGGQKTNDNQGKTITNESSDSQIESIVWIVLYSQIILILFVIIALIWKFAPRFFSRFQDDVLDLVVDTQEMRLAHLEKRYEEITNSISEINIKLEIAFNNYHILHDGLSNIDKYLKSLKDDYEAAIFEATQKFRDLADRVKKDIERLQRDLTELHEKSAEPVAAGERLQTPSTREALDFSGAQVSARQEMLDTSRFGLAVSILGCELPLGDAERQRLESAPSWQEFGHRLVGEVLPIRTSHQTLGKIDLQLGEVSNQGLRLIIPELNTRPQSAESEKVAERPIERGVYGLITALLRPGLRVNGQVVRRAEVEVGA